ncbi:MAG: hypothetical protein IKZ53_02275 [Selenomonadaceae bacterium]|nr:hypothetical protein [Selenomonadaceae bacterium]
MTGEKQYKIIFVCRGNTCRSAMAKYIMRHLLDEAGIDKVRVDSAGYNTSGGSPMREGARRELVKNKIPFDRHRSKPITLQIYEKSDCIIALDEIIFGKVKKKVGGDSDKKIRMLKDADGNNIIVKNPFNAHNYSLSYSKIFMGCMELLKDVTK